MSQRAASLLHGRSGISRRIEWRPPCGKPFKVRSMLWPVMQRSRVKVRAVRPNYRVNLRFDGSRRKDERILEWPKEGSSKNSGEINRTDDPIIEDKSKLARSSHCKFNNATNTMHHSPY